ncbi:MAG TPA: hypothetical protein VMI34_21865 [Candidatus Bathyarchaeia archaeon]|nr:hypothetical protein [Candidatus Bathyarchaeia archaeon]
MNLGDIIRVLEVPATVPAETAPARAPEKAPPEPAREPVETDAVPAERAVVPVRLPPAGSVWSS